MGLGRTPSGAGRNGQNSFSADGIGQNSFRIGWEQSEFLPELAGLVKIPLEAGRSGGNSFRSGRE